MSRKKTVTQVICREVLLEVIEWKKVTTPDDNTLRRGIKILLLRRLNGLYAADENQTNGLIGGVISMLSNHERKVSSQLDLLTNGKLDALTGFLRPAIQPPNVDLALYDEDATAKMRASLLKDMEETPEGMDSNEIDFLSGLSGTIPERYEGKEEQYLEDTQVAQATDPPPEGSAA